MAVIAGRGQSTHVEFLVAFMPLFILFLSICQLALVGEARRGHAVLAGARSAIVVLEEAPEEHAGAAREILGAFEATSSIK